MTEIKIELDESVKDVKIFQSLKNIHLSKQELFKYAILMLEVPDHLSESDFDYLTSKIPALELLYSEFMDFTDTSIKNLSKDDRGKKMVSEAIGVGVGLKYTTTLLNTNPNKFKKITPLIKGKYLDYSTIKDGKEYEIETKGTVQTNYSRFKDDILLKKENNKKKKVFLRFGTIAMIQNKQDIEDTKCIIVDDPPEEIYTDDDDTFKTQLLNYAIFLSYILDSKYYNKYIKPLIKNEFKKIKINENKFFGQYKFKGKLYYGECFDYRLIKENLRDISGTNIKPETVFKELTHKVGKTKIFIGLDKDVINAINQKDVNFLNTYNSDISLEEDLNKSVFLDKDGIIIIKSRNGSDTQLEEIFTEMDVFNRLSLYNNYTKGTPHECGAPCRSREIRGKPCEIKTFRSNCHYHR